MANRMMLFTGILGIGVVCAVLADDRAWVGLDAGDPKLTRETANRIERALHERTECRFDDQPLIEVLEHLARQHDIPIWIDRAALQDEGIMVDNQMKLVITGVTLQTALDLLLQPMGLAYLTEDGLLKVTVQSKADEKMSLRVYPVADLVNGGASENDYERLMQIIERLAHSKWLDFHGEGGAVEAFPNARSVLVYQTLPTHRKIEGLLAALRKAKRLQHIKSISIEDDQPDFLIPASPAADSLRRRNQTSAPSQAWQRPQLHPAE